MSTVMQEVTQGNEALSHQVVSAVKTYLSSVSSKDANLDIEEGLNRELVIEEDIFVYLITNSDID